jgi:hypothetical protein
LKINANGIITGNKCWICLAILLTVVLASRQQTQAAERDVYDYDGQRNAPAGTRRIVFIATKGAHGGRGNHEFMAGALYFARRINGAYPKAFAVVYSDDKWPTDLSSADAIIVLLNHGGPAAENPAVKAAVGLGAGFMAIHFGVEVNKGAQGDNYLNWMGGYFETFYSVNPWWVPEFTVAKHPTTRGVKPFKARDEWYYHMRFRDEMKGVTPILTAVAPPSTINFKDTPSERGGNADVLKAVQAGDPQATAWAYERPGGGRGFGFTGFHDYYNLTNDAFRTLLLNAVAWVSKLDVPAGGVPSTTPTKQELDALMDEVHGPAKP